MADRNKEITLRLQYPKELAPVSECELDGLLAAMQKDQLLWPYEMTLGAEITESTTTAVEGSDGAPSRHSQPRGVVSVLSVEGNTLATNYYCRTAPSFQSGGLLTQESTDGPCPTAGFTPTILVEMFANVSIPNERVVVDAITDCISKCLRLSEKNISPKFRVMKYSTSAMDEDGKH